LFFDSAEPNFDALLPDEFFARFPEGQYEMPASLTFVVNLQAGITELKLSVGLANSGEALKLEVLVREASGSQTAVETCFEME